MLAAGGILALVMVGFLVDGMLSGKNDGDDDKEDANAAEGGRSDPGEEGVQGSGLTDILFGGPEDDRIDAGEGDDMVSGGAGNDLLLGAEGNDTLDGQEGSDTLDGGDGDDQIRLGTGDFGTGGEGADLFEVTGVAEDEDGETIACVVDFQAGVDRLVLDFDGGPEDAPEITFDRDGTPGSVIVLANGFPVTMLSGVSDVSDQDVEIRMSGGGVDETPTDDGDDEPEAYAGDDLLDGGTEDDVLRGRDGMAGLLGPSDADEISGGTGDDSLRGSESNDALFGGEGNDTLSGDAGADEIHGGDGNDRLSGGGGTDFLSGGDGNDIAIGGEDGDLIFGDDGDDFLSGGTGDDFLQGGFGADTLSGGDGNDRLDGTFAAGDAVFGPVDEDDADTLFGGSGDDVLVVGAGDMAIGGQGEDTFASGGFIDSAGAPGLVTDFNPSQDVIEVMFDPALTPDPIVTVQDFDDGSGANVLLDGQVVLRVMGAAGLNPADIDLQEIRLDTAPETA